MVTRSGNFQVGGALEYLPRRRRGSGGGAPQVQLPQNTLYAAGYYSAYIHPSGLGGGTLATTATITPGLFPGYTTATWSVSGGDASTVKGFLNLATYGNYLNNAQQINVIPAQIGNINTLTISHNVTASGTNYNILYDCFLSSDIIGQTRTFEVGVFPHISSPGLSYFTGLTTVGTTTISGVSWDVKIDNAASPKYILFVATDRADRFSGAWDFGAMLAYLVAQTATTGVTNDAFFVGLGFGVEAIQGTGSITINGFAVNYVVNLPAHTNFISNQDFRTAFWNLVNATASASDSIMELATNTQHGVLPAVAITRAAAVKNYIWQVDVSMLGATPRRGILMQVFDGSFGSSAVTPIDVVGGKSLWVNSSGWSNPMSIAAPLPGTNTLRCFLQWTTDATSTNLMPFPQMSPDPNNSVTTYPGDTSKGVRLSNMWVFDKDS